MLGLVVALNADHSCAVLNWAPVTFHPFIPRVGTVARHWLEVVSRVSLDTQGRRRRFRLGGSWDARMPYAGSMYTHMARVWVPSQKCTNRFESLNLPGVSSLIATSIVVKKINVLDNACFYKVFAVVWIRLGIT